MANQKADTAQDALKLAYASGPEAFKFIQSSIEDAGIGDTDAFVSPTSGTIDLTNASQAIRRIEFAPDISWELLAVYISFSTTVSVDIKVYIIRGTESYQIVTDPAITDTGWRMKVGALASQGLELFTKDYKLRIDFTLAASAKTATPHVIWRRL